MSDKSTLIQALTSRKHLLESYRENHMKSGTYHLPYVRIHILKESAYIEKLISKVLWMDE